MKLILPLVLILSVAYASQYVTIPKKQIGIFIGDARSDIKIQLIYDPVCDGSADFDIQFQQVYNSLSSDIKSKISLRFISLSLPYHMASHKLTQGILYVLQNKGDQQALTLMRNFLANKEQWYEQNIRNSTINAFMLRIAENINKLFGVKVEEVLPQLAHGSPMDAKTRLWSKVVMGSIKAAGTPRLLINGVNVDGVTSMTNQQIANLIKSLVSSTGEIDYHN